MPNPEDYPDPHNAPWKPQNNPRYNCYDYALNFPGKYSQPGQYCKGRLRMEFLSSAASEWQTFVHIPDPPEWMRPHLKKAFTGTVRDAVSDGLIPIHNPVSCRGFRLISLQFIMAQHEFGHHWARLDKNGRWSDKNGDKRIRNVRDEQGEPVLWPHISYKPDAGSLKRNDHHYIFGSYFLVPSDAQNLGDLPFDKPPLPLLEF